MKPSAAKAADVLPFWAERLEILFRHLRQQLCMLLLFH